MARHGKAWTERSVLIANKRGYLDKLLAIYPIEFGGRRKLSQATRKQIISLHKKHKGLQLLRLLINLEKLPIEHPYFSMLKKGPHLVRKNPKVARKLASALMNLECDDLLRRCEEPKVANRRMGGFFRKWLRERSGLRLVTVDKLSRSRGIVVLNASDRALRRFAERTLGYRVRKNPDFIVKTRHQFVIGEVKFVTQGGGNQNNQVREILAFVRGQRGRAIRVGVVDGAVWFRGGGELVQRLQRNRGSLVSALLLKRFLNSVR